jgi:hypothetical protein
MKIIVHILVILFLLISCNSTPLNPKEKEINDILFTVIQDNTDLFENSCGLIDKFDNRIAFPTDFMDNDSVFLSTLEPYFSNTQKDELLTQLRNSENFGFVTREFKKKYNLIKTEKIDALFSKVEKSLETNEPKDISTEISKKFGCVQGFLRPIISSDGQTILITYYMFCGPMCGGGFSRVFNKKNGVWIKIGIFNYWIS